MMKRVFFLIMAAAAPLAACSEQQSQGSAPEVTATTMSAPSASAGSLGAELPVPAEFEAAAFPLSEGDAFLEAFAAEEGAEKRDNGAVVQTLVEGTGATPGENDLVKVHFVARLAGELEPFGSTYRDGAPVIIGMDQALPGWRSTFQTMKAGSLVRAALPASLAFGEQGMGSAIPPGAVTVYDFALLDVYKVDDDETLAALESDMKGVVEKYSQEAQRLQGLAQQQISSLNTISVARSNLFVEAQAARPETTKTESGLVYEVVSSSDSGESPKIGDTITVHYSGTFPNGEVFDSSYSRGQPATFELGRVIEGWNEGLQLMKPGDKYKLYIPGQLAYGPRGTPDGSIGPNQALVFDVELISVEPAPPAEDAGE